MRIIVMAGVLAAGCSAFERKVEYVPFEVKVPVPVACAAEIPAEPAWKTEGLPVATPENFDQHVRALLAERRQRIGYEKQLKAAVAGCQ